MEGAAFVFINFIQAGRLGHVGWGFLIDPVAQTYYFGSTDHLWRRSDDWWNVLAWLRYAHVNPSGHNDWWSGTGTHDDMLSMMSTGHHIRYHAAKRVSVLTPFPQRAFSRAEGMQHAGWSVLVNNCVHQTYCVLSDYGASLPPPSGPPTNLIPKNWFASIEGEYIEL